MCMWVSIVYMIACIHRYTARNKKKKWRHVGQGLVTKGQICRPSKSRDAVHGRHCSAALGIPAERFVFKLLLAQKQNSKLGNWDGINLLCHSNYFAIYVSHNIIFHTLNISHVSIFLIIFGENSSCQNRPLAK